MNLKAIRNQQGISAAKLSGLSGVPIRTIEDIEHRDDCRVSTAIRLADALCVTLDKLCRKPESE